MNKFDYRIDGDVYELGWAYMRELYKRIPGIRMEYLESKLFDFLRSKNLNISDRQRVRIQSELMHDFIEVMKVMEYEY